jgi:hypothetical protein
VNPLIAGHVTILVDLRLCDLFRRHDLFPKSVHGGMASDRSSYAKERRVQFAIGTYRCSLTFSKSDFKSCAPP